MELQLEHPGNYPHVHHVDEHSVAVIEHDQLRTLTRSFILAADHIIEDWAVAEAGTLVAAQIEPILQLQPEVVLLGTGRTLVFPPAGVMAAFLQKGIGIEPMDNAAAARTHTILAGEDRHVVAAFML